MNWRETVALASVIVGAVLWGISTHLRLTRLERWAWKQGWRG